MVGVVVGSGESGGVVGVAEGACVVDRAVVGGDAASAEWSACVSFGKVSKDGVGGGEVVAEGVVDGEDSVEAFVCVEIGVYFRGFGEEVGEVGFCRGRFMQGLVVCRVITDDGPGSGGGEVAEEKVHGVCVREGDEAESVDGAVVVEDGVCAKVPVVAGGDVSVDGMGGWERGPG